MNSNQKLQCEKIRKILQVNQDLEKKIRSHSQQISDNNKKVEKILSFLEKQKISEEEVQTYLSGSDQQEEVSETLQPKVQGFGQ